MTGRRYLVYDVFTDTPLQGNPLAIVLDAEGLDAAAMQRIAREFNLSETVFVRPAHENPVHAASIRIFTPNHEMPFAGHPTVGTAVALSELGGGAAGESTSLLVIEEAIGDLRCAVAREGQATFAEFDLPQMPQKLPFEVEPAAIAAALGIGQHEIGFENHRIGLWSAGVPFATIPVSGIEVAARIAIDAAMWLELASLDGGGVADPYVYCRETVNHDCAFHMRMFAPYGGIAEDPATGSAAAAFAGAVHAFDRPVDGRHRLWLEQGIEMGRPSRIRLEIDVEGGEIAGARIGGHAVKVAEGVLLPG